MIDEHERTRQRFSPTLPPPSNVDMPKTSNSRLIMPRQLRVKHSLCYHIHQPISGLLLKINPSKRVFSLVKFPCGTLQAIRDNSSFFFVTSDHKFRPSKNIKVLGVMIDQSLTWESHVSLVVRRCAGILVSLDRFRRHFTTTALLTIIRGHVSRHILWVLLACLGQRFRQPAEPHPKAGSLRSPSGH